MKPTAKLSFVAVILLMTLGLWAASLQRDDVRPPANDEELKYWLGNMIWHHGYNEAEVMSATGLSFKQVLEARKKFDIRPDNKPQRPADAPILVLPYPGGRHPRIGFQDGAVWPQRETKISVFLPWDPASYIVVDTPEAIWSNLGLTYLAHYHVPTIWDKQGVELEPLEWDRHSDGSLDLTRKLPNGIAFTSRVVPHQDHVELRMTLHNGTKEKLSDLRVQMCAMLKMAKGFNTQTNQNKVFKSPYAAVKSEDGKRWIIFAWSLCHRPWGNEHCPCLHSDPKFPDCEPGQTQKLVGRMSFYEGEDLQAELERIEKTGWQKD